MAGFVRMLRTVNIFTLAQLFSIIFACGWSNYSVGVCEILVYKHTQIPKSKTAPRGSLRSHVFQKALLCNRDWSISVRAEKHIAFRGGLGPRTAQAFFPQQGQPGLKGSLASEKPTPSEEDRAGINTLFHPLLQLALHTGPKLCLHFWTMAVWKL